MKIYPIVQPKMHEYTYTVREQTASNLKGSEDSRGKPNLKNKLKLAGEEIDEVLNIWILQIHKEYISTFT